MSATGFDETVIMLLDSLESVPVVVQEQVVKKKAPTVAAPMNRTPLHIRAGGQASDFVRKGDRKAAEAAAAAAAGASEGEDGEGEGGDDDDEDDDEDEELEPLPGQPAMRAVTRREFLLTPKPSMIVKKK